MQYYDLNLRATSVCRHMMGVLAFRRVFAFRSKALAVLFVNRTSSIVTEIWICNGKWRCVETVTRCVQAVTSVRRCVETVTSVR